MGSDRGASTGCFAGRLSLDMLSGEEQQSPSRCDGQVMNAKGSSPRAATRCGQLPSHALGARLFSHNAWQALSVSLNLSSRELEIVRGVFEDRTESAIAADLRISPHTVHTHVERLHHKLGVANRVQLVLRVMDEFLSLTVSTKSLLPPICASWHAGRCPMSVASARPQGPRP